MKNDTIGTFLNLVLAVLVILGVIFAVIAMNRTHKLRALQFKAQVAQINFMRAQQLANDVAIYNATAKNPELTQILQNARTPQPAAK